jgi:hypothetical protein
LLVCAAVGCPEISLISVLAALPLVYYEWFWLGAFNSAVTSRYLGSLEQPAMREVVALVAVEFATYLAGVGITGEPHIYESTRWAHGEPIIV